MGAHWALGATTVGLRVEEGVVLASEKRVSYGFTVTSKSAKKIFKITDYLGIACAGLIGDMQAIARSLRAEVKLYELDVSRRMPIKAAAKLLANILFSQRYMPLMSETLVGGLDNIGPHLYVLDAIGSLIEDDYAALGSGSTIAIGVLETNYRKNMSIEEAINLAMRSVKAAIERDALSGDGIDMLIITESKAEERFEPVK
ncbi:MAG: archaeal proteasome endopeptidase complex subunit beta [Candidatus Nezhaarchaeota archaeon]|nr:archaeal proteasome endopeptidase complex subunit beta [Candidatus Nezhaarchaeota archaeon]MCX8142126.1 archaeal proteasome endopeptidase complex subunit beta [Candidatus Nezhaarchaeota archaeon]MDW8050093.1 archaeal proteasome endopeptidase complex subunit beta [Nitrososphaerota archaeon]